MVGWGGACVCRADREGNVLRGKGGNRKEKKKS